MEGKITKQSGMEEAAEKGKETSHSAHVNERMIYLSIIDLLSFQNNVMFFCEAKVSVP